jgi:CRISPR system Cascade subunit CasB
MSSQEGNYAAAFARDLEDLVTQKNLAALAALRRAVGREPGQAMEPYRYLGRWLANGRPALEDACFLVAGLFAMHRLSWPDDGQGPHNLGASFYRLKEKTNSGSVEQRFVALLNCHDDDLASHLRQAVSLLKAHEVPVDWAELLRDVQRWRSEQRWVQRRWARSFWSEAAPATGARGNGNGTAPAPPEQSESEPDARADG